MEHTNKIILEKLFDLENKINLINERLYKIENHKNKKRKIKIISLEDKLFLASCKINYKKLNYEKK